VAIIPRILDSLVTLGGQGVKRSCGLLRGGEAGGLLILPLDRSGFSASSHLSGFNTAKTRNPSDFPVVEACSSAEPNLHAGCRRATTPDNRWRPPGWTRLGSHRLRLHSRSRRSGKRVPLGRPPR